MWLYVGLDVKVRKYISDYFSVTSNFNFTTIYYARLCNMYHCREREKWSKVLKHVYDIGT